jgi:DNA-binding NarL/FixJ family response regulator
MPATPTPRAPHTSAPGPRSADLHVLLVDSQPVVRVGLGEVLRGAFGAVRLEGAGDVPSALERIEQGSFRLLVADVELIGGSGLELTKQARTRWPALRVLLFSGHDEMLFAQRALSAGASGYVMKQEDPEVIVRAVRAVLDGKLHVSPRVRRQFVRGLTGLGEPSSPVEQLSDRELEVFAYLGRGLTRGEVGRALNLSVKTVESYRARIKQKLGLESASMLLRSAVHWVNQEATQTFVPSPEPPRALDGYDDEAAPAAVPARATGT